MLFPRSKVLVESSQLKSSSVDRRIVMVNRLTFTYSPIAAHSIRLLRLEPGAAADPIQFSLEPTFLDSGPIYEAISYCWGDAPNDVDVNCQGASMKITRNLWRALQEFRHDIEPRILWADAICIKQEDYDEKNCQVNLMSDIYSKAKLVLIWLGPMDETDLLRSIGASIQEAS